MFGLPLEFIITIITTILGWWMKKSILDREIEREEREANRDHGIEQDKIYQNARQFGASNAWFQAVQLIVCMMIIFFVVVFPKLVVLWKPELGVAVSYIEHLKSWVPVVGQDQEYLKWIVMNNGILITPLDTTLCTSVGGFLLGNSMASRTAMKPAK
jgi:hypothetical protein